MKKHILFALFLCVGGFASAQHGKPTPSFSKENYPPESLKLRPDAPRISVPPAENPFGAPEPNAKPLPRLRLENRAPAPIKTVSGENGLPIFFEGKTAASGSSMDKKAPEARAMDYLASLQPQGIKNPASEFRVQHAETDEVGNLHVRLAQFFEGIPVFGAELIAHTREGAFDRVNGRYFPTPDLTELHPLVDENAALQSVKTFLGPDKVKSDWTSNTLSLVGGKPHQAELVIYHRDQPGAKALLAWHLTLYTDVLHRSVWFVDAITGEIADTWNYTCEIAGHRHGENDQIPETGKVQERQFDEKLMGKVTGTGLDLMDSTRSFGAWEVSPGQIVLEDASLSMFNPATSSMPNDPVGAIVTLDALNTSPEVEQTFEYSFLVSGSTSFTNKTAVSAHWNSIRSYKYFESRFNRKSIDGVGGNIIAFINVAEADGSSMENAFWNGAAMWYGNGGASFRPLARGIDVGGHEMAHGVIEKTANLVYQNESGALNESFADVFGVLIDRNDWKIGEDVVKTGIIASNCLRDLQNPNNGVSNAHPFWQPKHVNEKYNGTQDNGGVHINSGIPNHAFYLFASNAAVGKDKAEQVYYKALRDYLVKSSKFIDCRIAVVQAAQDLYGTTVADAAAAAFAAVGIGSGNTGGGGQPGGNYLGQLTPNPGDNYILCVSADGTKLDLYSGGGVFYVNLYKDGVASRPSISDNGSQMVFVNTEGHIISVDFLYTPTEIFYTVNGPITLNPNWRNAAISKDGRFLAGLTKNKDDRIIIFDLADPLFASETFFLYNPTYSNDNTITGEVKYADVMEFDYSGKSLMYDAYNELISGQNDLSYWDIGFLEFWKNNAFVDGGNAFISKLFTGLPENTSIGNPAIAKNSPFIIAFDFIDYDSGTNDIMAANTETGDYNFLVKNSGSLGWPNYTHLDDAVIFERETPTTFNIFKQAIKANKIEGTGSAVQIIANHGWGVWYADGNRSLMVDAPEAQNARALNLRVSPNPVIDRANMALTLPRATEAQVQWWSIEGRLLGSRKVEFVAGENNLELDFGAVPKGAFILRLLGENLNVSTILTKIGE